MSQLAPVHIRGLDPEVWKAMRIEALCRDLTVAQLIELMWRNMSHNEVDELRTALSDAIDLAEEGWAYDSGYFRQKWDVENRIAALRSVLDSVPSGACLIDIRAGS